MDGCENCVDGAVRFLHEDERAGVAEEFLGGSDHLLLRSDHHCIGPMLAASVVGVFDEEIVRSDQWRDHGEVVRHQMTSIVRISRNPKTPEFRFLSESKEDLAAI